MRIFLPLLVLSTGCGDRGNDNVPTAAVNWTPTSGTLTVNDGGAVSAPGPFHVSGHITLADEAGSPPLVFVSLVNPSDPHRVTLASGIATGSGSGKEWDYECDVQGKFDPGAYEVIATVADHSIATTMITVGGK